MPSSSFSPHQAYEVAKPLKFQGRQYRPGEPFDVELDLRAARLLYDARMIRVQVEPQPPAAP